MKYRLTIYDLSTRDYRGDMTILAVISHQSLTRAISIIKEYSVNFPNLQITLTEEL
jgi:hypothetical protein